MEDYIFLIIAIVLSIFGVINQSNKKKIQENRILVEDEEPQNQFMNELFDDDFLSKPEVSNIPPFQAKPKEVNFVTKSNIVIPRGEFYHQGFKSTLPERPKHEMIKTKWTQREEDEIAETDESGNYLEDFSLRKAFIYSEILNRKY